MNELVHLLLEEAADHFPDHPAVVDVDREMTYRQLDAVANRIAHQLAELNVCRGDRIGLYLEKSAESLACVYGVLKAGAAYVPLAPDAPVARLANLIRHAKIRILLSGIERAGQWSALVGGDSSPIEHLVCVNGLVGQDHEVPGAAMLDTADLARWPEYRPDVAVGADDPAYVLFTSGSTGIPKGVVLSHHNALSFVDWGVAEFGLMHRDRLSSHAPLHFDLSIFDLFAAASVAATVVIVPREVAMFPAELATFVRATDISVWYSVPLAVNMLASRSGLEPGKLPRLRIILFAGEVFPVSQLRQALVTFPDAEFYNLYGPTETNVCTYYHVPRPLAEECHAIPIGRPISGVELFCLDEDGHPTGVNERGELWVSGPTVMRGYLNDPEQTAEVLRAPDPGRAEIIAYRTGDITSRDEDGVWHFFGRRDSQIKSRGYRIELGEIEASLNAHPAVLECAVIAVPDVTFGNRIKAYVITKEAVSTTVLASYLRQLLPTYMVPSSFDRRTALPRTSNGKIDYNVLKK